MTSDTKPPEAEPSAGGSSPAPPPAVPPGESRRERLSRHAHRVRLYTGAVAFVGLVSVLVVLITVNTRSVKLSWAFGSTTASIVWIILATAVIGWLLGIATAVVFRLRTRRPR